MRRARVLAPAAAALLGPALLLAGCGGSSTKYVPPSGPPVATLRVSARDFAFTPKNLQAPAGVLEVELKSTEGQHDFVLQGVPGFKVSVDATGSSAEQKVDLKPGKYTFYCSLPGHRAAGMVGTLTVR